MSAVEQVVQYFPEPVVLYFQGETKQRRAHRIFLSQKKESFSGSPVLHSTSVKLKNTSTGETLKFTPLSMSLHNDLLNVEGKAHLDGKDESVTMVARRDGKCTVGDRVFDKGKLKLSYFLADGEKQTQSYTF